MKISTRLFLIFSVCTLALAAQHSGSGVKPLSFLHTGPAQTMPSPQAMENALASLGEKTIRSQHIAVITKAFAYSTVDNQNRLLINMRPENEKLAETLIIYRSSINQAVAKRQDLQPLIETVFYHYVINTQPGVFVKDSNESQELFDGLSRYAKYLGVDYRKNGQGKTVFSLNGKSEDCINCSEPSINSLHYAGITINKMRYGQDDVISSAAFTFNGTTTAYSPENAAVLADFAHLAYFKEEVVQNQLRQWGYDSFQWLEGRTTDTQAFIAEKDTYQIISFRGTESVKDMITDIWFRKIAAYDSRGKVHAGFERAVNDVWDTLLAKVKKNKPIYISGHSLGAALAQLVAYRLSLHNYTVSGVYTYGSPRVGNLTFKEAYDARLAEKTFLHINDRDLVAAVPPELLGFINLGNQARQFDENHKITITTTRGSTVPNDVALEYEQLNERQKSDLKSQMEEVASAIEASTAFLREPTHVLPSNTYSPTNPFESGKLNNHKMGQYLFKLACAMVERAWDRVQKTR